MALDKGRLEELARFRFALRRFLAASEAISRAGGITPQQYQALLAIKTKHGEAMAMKDLAEQLMLTHHAAVQLVDRLARADLAARQKPTKDRRTVLLKLTTRGEELLERLASSHIDEILRQEPMLSSSLLRLKQAAS
jgi:DNA-binding MarR family transcriptional regulator